MSRIRYYEHLRIKLAIEVHASFHCATQGTFINVLTYPVPSDNNRKYVAEVIGTTPPGHKISLGRAQHCKGEFAAMKALLGALQAATSQVLQVDDGRRGSDDEMEDAIEELVERLRMSIKRGLRRCFRSFPFRDVFLRYTKGTEEGGHEPQHESVPVRGHSGNTLLEGGSEGHGNTPPNAPGNEHAYSGSGRLNGNAEFEHFIRRTAALEDHQPASEAHEDSVAPPRPIRRRQGLEEREDEATAYENPAAPQAYTTPIASPSPTNSIYTTPNTVRPHTSRTESFNKPLSHKYVYPPHIPPSHSQSLHSTSSSSITARVGSYDHAESLPPAYASGEAFPRPAGVVPQRRKLWDLDVGSSAYTESVSQRRERWEAMQRPKS